MHQPSLFHDVHPRIDPEDTRTRPADRPPASVLEDQPSLFQRPVMLRVDLDAAIADGRFEDARRCYLELVGDWGESAVPSDTSFVAALDLSIFDRPIGELLDRWRRLTDEHCLGRGACQRAWRGLIVRCRGAFSPQALAAVRPECLPHIANALWTTAGDAPGASTEARELVRDTLCEGHELRAEDFLDGAVRDLLSENLEPEWLASLGALRRVWSVTVVDGTEAATVLQRQTGTDRREFGRWFWDCLCVARSPTTTDALRQEARRRMKRLDPELHAIALHGPR
jgi:hypothetical protein